MFTKKLAGPTRAPETAAPAVAHAAEAADPAATWAATPSAGAATPTVPASVPHAGGVSADEFRAAMSRLAAGVVVITAHDEEDGISGEPAAMTATAFMSVSLDPPLVMVSVRNGSRMDDVLERQPLWGVSVLSDRQRHIAGRFAMKGRISDRLIFQEVPHENGPATGAPLIHGALAVMECRTEQRVVAGDHTLTIGRVLTAHTASVEGEPLMYFRGRYRHLE